MILSVSRRTDIPAFYSDWFFSRLDDGFVLVANPFNPHQIRRIDLTPPAVDGIVFWTRNPQPMLDRLDRLCDYTYYFQITLNAYGPPLEPDLPGQREAVAVFCELSRRLGPDRTIWRYDPILLTDDWTVERHIGHFAELAGQLAGFTRQCTISFLDAVRRNPAARRQYGLRAPQTGEIHQLASPIAEIGRNCGLEVKTCAEAIDLSMYGIGHASCIDASRITRLCGRPLNVAKDRNQRPACGCSASVDLGAYETCCYGCVYCYATSQSRPAGTSHGSPADTFRVNPVRRCGSENSGSEGTSLK